MNILVTGGASGLGETIVNKLVINKKDNIFFTYSKSMENAKKITDSFSNAVALHCDFTDKISIENLLCQIQKLDIDILINNAVTSLKKQHFHKVEITELELSFKNNIVPTLQITQECIRIFRKKKFGKIITIISSVVINKPPIGWSEYVAEKNYLQSMSKSWATENIRFNISSNCISPSFMKSSLTSDIDERIVSEIINSHPLKRLLKQNEVAESVDFLLHCSQQINGINLLLNAGSDLI